MMLKRIVPRLAAAAVATVSLGSFGGCGEPNSPKIVEAPAYAPPAVQEPPKIPGRKQAYGANSKYQEAMERAANR